MPFFGTRPLLSIHVDVSLIAIATGFVVMWGLLANNRLPRMTAAFLACTIATSVTGFFLPADRFMPSHALGILSLIALAAALAGRYGLGLLGPGRQLYVIGAVIAQYFDVVVLVFQSFDKVPALHALGPEQGAPAVIATQLVVLVAFVLLGVLGTKRFQKTGPA